MRTKEEKAAYAKKWYLKNKEKVYANVKAWQKANPEKYRLYIRKRDLGYNGLTIEKFEKLVEEQNNKCKLCEKKFNKTPHVDHDHKTNKVRGLLCKSCNTMLGWYERRKETICQYVAG